MNLSHKGDSVKSKHREAKISHERDRYRRRIKTTQINTGTVQHVEFSHKGNSGRHQEFAYNQLCIISQYFNTHNTIMGKYDDIQEWKKSAGASLVNQL